MSSWQAWPPTFSLQSVLTNRFMVYTGTISYGIYLLQKIPLDAAKTFHVDKHPLLLLPLTAATAYAAAAISWNLLEKPILNLKRFFRSKSYPPGPGQPRAFELGRRVRSSARDKMNGMLRGQLKQLSLYATDDKVVI